MNPLFTKSLLNLYDALLQPKIYNLQIWNKIVTRKILERHKYIKTKLDTKSWQTTTSSI